MESKTHYPLPGILGMSDQDLLRMASEFDCGAVGMWWNGGTFRGRVFIRRCEGFRLPQPVMWKVADDSGYVLCKNARLERLQDITEEEAQSEGFDTMEKFSAFHDQHGVPFQSRTTWSKSAHPEDIGSPCARQTFSAMWSEINDTSRERWEDNPEVVRVPFKVVKA